MGCEERTKFVTVRMTPQFKIWLEKFAKSERSSLTKLLDTAIIELADSRKFKPAPPPR